MNRVGQSRASPTPRLASAAVAAYGEQGALQLAEFQARVAALTAALRERAEQRWALVCDDTLAFATGFLALGQAGKTIILPHAPQQASVSAIEPQVQAVLSDTPQRFPALPALIPGSKASGGAVTAAEPDAALGVEFYTSGSSGTPKRVIKTWGQLQAEVENLERVWGTGLGDAVILATVPHYHLYGLLFRVLWPLHARRAIYARTLLQPLELAEIGKRFPRCAVISSPAFLTRVMDFDAGFPPRQALAAVFSSGAPLPADAAEQAYAGLGLPVTEVYGSTETGGIAWRAHAPGAGQGSWQQFPPVRTETRSSAEDPRPHLWVRSPWTSGTDWMETGDLAEHGDDGGFRLLGRADTLLKLEDKRISLAELGRWLSTHEWVAEARLVLVPGRRTVIGAVVVLNPRGRERLDAQGVRTVRETLAQACLARYEAVVTPRKWRFVEALPVNAMGKSGEAELKALFGEPA